jgi:acetyl/propionyl-CoA carboxylase alpha subunit
VEFILDPSGKFYFLEMNTRLQVEHPITEMTTGLDLVREQILIASGASLAYSQEQLRQTGHAIECRIYAEVPEEQFRPDTGTIAVYEPPSGPGIRLDSGVLAESVVSYHFDPLLAKLIVWAPSRTAAIDRMKRALSDFALLGVRNNIEFLHSIISTEDFLHGKTDTSFLDRHPELFSAQNNVPVEALLVGAVYDRPLLKGSANPLKTGGHRPPLQEPWSSGAWRNS